MNTEAIKTQGIQVGLVTAGFMGANLVSKVTPIKNDKIKAAIPLLLGMGAALVSKDEKIKLVGASAASYGLLKVIRSVVLGSDPTGTNGMEGIGDNPAVKKIVGMLIPNLGEIEDIPYAQEVSSENYFEPAIVDVPFDELGGLENDSVAEKALLGSQNKNLLEEGSLLGLDYENELYL